MTSNLKSKIKTIASDSILSIVALVIMNMVAQFVVYPFWKRAYGTEFYGHILYAMSIVNIFSISVGTAANNARMVESVKGKTQDGDYSVFVLIGSAISAVGILPFIIFGGLDMDLTTALFTGVLTFVTCWRYYCDVEFRLNINYKGYFLYYIIISIGYAIGIVLMRFIPYWPVALIPGELAGLIYVKIRGSVISGFKDKRSSGYKVLLGTILLLALTYCINNLVFNGDRLLLEHTLGGDYVTIYYLGSLVGKTMTLITSPMNSVIIGYLARYHGRFTNKMVTWLLGVTFGTIVVFSGLSVLGSYILIYILYPESFQQALPYFLIGNAAQIFYFVANVVTTVLLRMAKANYQLKINIVYALTFLICCIPTTILGGLWGFCFAILFVNIVRYAMAIILCYTHTGDRTLGAEQVAGGEQKG